MINSSSGKTKIGWTLLTMKSTVSRTRIEFFKMGFCLTVFAKIIWITVTRKLGDINYKNSYNSFWWSNPLWVRIRKSRTSIWISVVSFIFFIVVFVRSNFSWNNYILRFMLWTMTTRLPMMYACIMQPVSNPNIAVNISNPVVGKISFPLSDMIAAYMEIINLFKKFSFVSSSVK